METKKNCANIDIFDEWFHVFAGIRLLFLFCDFIYNIIVLGMSAKGQTIVVFVCVSEKIKK